MPNIEIRGFQPETADELKESVKKAFQGKPYETEYVISIVPCDVTDYREFLQPFIRLVTTDQPHNAEIIEELRSLGVDVEFAPLIAFYPKK